MPRRGRLHIPGAYYHVIGRGLERRYVFSEASDKADFLSRLGAKLAESQTQCLAWALMSNHYHLLLRVGSQPLSKLMAPILGGYAGYYNRKHGRAGYVFQNRYQSILVDADNYLLELIRYIRLNPLRAGMVESIQQLETYPWTGHKGMVSSRYQQWHSVNEALELFGVSRRKALRNYKRFMAEADGEASNPSLSGGGLIRSAGGWEQLSRYRKEHTVCVGDERILGSSEFVENALRMDDLELDQQSRLATAGWGLDRLILAVCELHSLKPIELSHKTRNSKASKAKSLICYWGTERLGLQTRDIAEALKMTSSAVSYRARRGREYCESEKISFEELIG